ncbi:MAG TPA: hypothetical protein VM939_00760, partial [Gemmatimonadaceae bacterium]|nr:hypothetical protein [Gemmatimonadaceae bacterium]
DLTVMAFDARVRLYPSVARGFFVNGGLGFGTISSDLIAVGAGEETGFGGMLGMGFDFRLGTAASITPFVNGVFVQTDNSNASFGQVGVGITFQRTRRAGLLDF